MGDRDASNASFGYHFKGQHTVKAAVHLMVSKYGLGQIEGQTLVLAGGSAGGRGAMVNLDYMKGSGESEKMIV